MSTSKKLEPKKAAAIKWIILLAIIFIVLIIGIGFWGTKKNEFYSRFALLEINQDLEKCGSKTKEKKCVVEGSRGWLFLQESLVNAVVPWTDNTSSIIAFRDSLQARGLTLIVVPVPDKLQVESSHYLWFFDEKLIPSSYSHWEQKLQKAGVPVVDALEQFRAIHDSIPMFEPYESHSTAASRLLLAKAVADSLHKKRPDISAEHHYVIRDTLVHGSGNLFYLQNEKFPSYQVHETKVVTEQGIPFRSSPKAPIIVIGDSNTSQGRAFASDIGSLIAYYTGLETFTISKVGAGNFGPRLFKGKDAFLQGKTAVVWVFDGRELYGKIVMPSF